MNSWLVQGAAGTKQSICTGADMHFETTRRRFIAMLSSLLALPQVKGGASRPHARAHPLV